MIDVRSPSEFQQGHIPEAYNIPIFSDEERAEVGTLYKQTSQEAAMQKGLELVGPKLKHFAQEVKKIAGNKKVMVYCWRGGMRSDSFSWLLNLVGVDVIKLHGGYKAYRSYIRASFNNKANMIILGGHTGSGKTDLLIELGKQGYQILDLEGYANHKGSAFGYLGTNVQPNNEQFENNLFVKWNSFNFSKPIFVEDESIMVGKVKLMEELFQQMKEAKKIVRINVSKEDRLDRLVRDYASVEKKYLIIASNNIAKRLGGDRLQTVLKLLEDDNFRGAADILLSYYDKLYEKGLAKRDQSVVKLIELPSVTMSERAEIVANTLFA